MLYYTTGWPKWLVRYHSGAMTEEERGLIAALILAGKPITNQELSDNLGVSPAEASKRIKRAHKSLFNTIRKGRRMQISLAL